MELKDALKETIKRNGKEVLSDTNLLKSYLTDLTPDQTKDIQILTDASRHHFFDGIARCDENNLSGALEEFRKSASSLFVLPVVENIEEMFKYALDMDGNSGKDTQEEVIQKEKTEFSVEDGVLLGYGGSSEIARIPPEVRSISSGAFRDSPEIQEVIIPEGVTEIKENTFLGCRKLRRVVLPSTLKTIEANAFDGCRKLEDIILPASLRTIKKDAFRDTGKLDCSRMFKSCIQSNVSLDIADKDLAEEYRRLIPGKKGFDKRWLLLLLIPAAALPLLINPGSSSPTRQPVPSSTPAPSPVPTATPAEDVEKIQASKIWEEAAYDVAGMVSEGRYEEASDKMFELKETLGTNSISPDFPIIFPYDGRYAGIYKTSKNEYAFYLGDYTDNMEREGDAFYTCTEDALKGYHSYYFGTWKNDKPNGYQTQYFTFYEGSEKTMDEEITGFTIDGIFDGEYHVQNNINNKLYTGRYNNGIVEVLGTEIDSEGIERKIIAYTDDKSSWYYYPEDEWYSEVQGVEGFY